MRFCTNFDETLADYNFSLPGAFTILIAGSYPDLSHSSWHMVIGMIIFV
jgi:hypothetical protein